MIKVTKAIKSMKRLSAFFFYALLGASLVFNSSGGGAHERISLEEIKLTLEDSSLTPSCNEGIDNIQMNKEGNSFTFRCWEDSLGATNMAFNVKHEHVENNDTAATTIIISEP